MEIRPGSILLVTALLSGCSWFHRADKGPPPVVPETAQDEPPIVQPQVERRVVKTPHIKAKDFEIGAYYGALSIENFGTNPLYGADVAYHVTEDIFLQGNVARSKAGKSSLEEVFPQITVLGESGRQFTYYDADVGYNFLPGEVFLGKGRAYNTALYATVGMGAVKFAETDHFALNFGVGTRILVTDWLSLHLDVRDHIFESALFGVTKNTHNIEAALGLSVFF
jgi:outer membrane beta-barrel protein